jgi:hypothetical protein
MNEFNKITRKYDIISDMKKNKVTEALDNFSNVDFKPLNGSNPSADNINVSLLQDIQTAAKNANLKVDITTAITGHRPGTRHETGNAVDIAIINGKAVSTSNRTDADKLVGELVKLGYAKNVAESGNDKVVLTFGMKDHDNHVHVSKKSNTDSSSSPLSTDPESEDDTPSEEGGFLSSYAKNIAKSIMGTNSKGEDNTIDIGKMIGLTENINRIKELLK